MLLNLGIGTILVSFGVFYGWSNFFKTKFLVGDRKPIGIGLLVSIPLGLYFSVIKDSHLMSIVCLLAEVACLLYYVAAFFPGGKEGLTYLLKGAWRGLAACCRRTQN